ncbi:flagellar hook-associated protein 1 FlgK [Krasilnikovia cinnamomea]|uniref:Flagellar hook-associated protein 1 n=1 Tax=Krasilnikovia cinnamomea TaxID=349313 RepID=A0A4V6MG40_9ACTN|nr:flagellar hook-associated protein FlgK [Krasilnikovia cinnamomea]RZU50446.1 flagellar hook-associated protein 1 FlgK [Krasilnikovia cinnamomea]
MSSSFGSLSIALSGLYANRRGLDVSGQNIANVNTEGYSRQRVQMQSVVGGSAAAMYARSDGLGDGVEVTSVQRLRSQFLEERGRSEHAIGSYLTTTAAIYNSIEDTFAEPSDTAMQAQLHDMWASWADVANAPDDLAARSALLQKSATVADGLRNAHGALASQWEDMRGQVDAFAAEINQTATAIADLNKNIVLARASGATVNELEDQRDLHVMHLAEMVGATAYQRQNGAVDVLVGGSPLVSEFNARSLEVTGAQRLQDQGVDPVQLRWTDAPAVSPIAGGKMGAMLDALTTIIPDLSADLDNVAKTLIDTVNAAHTPAFGLDGVNGRPFFSGTVASDIAVDIPMDKPTWVGAAPTAGTFDGTVADLLSRTGATSTGPDTVYQNMIAELGVASQTLGRRADIQGNITLQIDSAREAEAGVNLDEEMTNLLTYQRGYEAASRVLTTIDQMLDQLINRTGLVGR